MPRCKRRADSWSVRAASVGITDFGASTPFERLYKAFGLTAKAVAAPAA